MPTLKVESFEGGMTDDYIDGPLNSGERMNNILINRFRKAEQRPGITIYDGNYPQIPPGNQQIDSIFFFDKTVFAKSGTKLYHLDNGAGWVTLAGPTGNDAFADSSLGAKASWSVWRGHVIITPGPTPTSTGGFRTVKVYRNASGVWTLIQAGLPDADGAYRFTFDAGGISTNGEIQVQYIYYAVFYRSYVAKVNGINTTFEDYSKPAITSIVCDQVNSDFVLFDPNTIDVEGILYANASGENYDTANTRARLFRTKENGTTPFYTGKDHIISGPTYYFNDNVDDKDLTSELYPGVTDGSFNNPAPKSYFSMVIGSFGFYGAGKDDDSGDLHTNRIWQSKPSDFDGVPSGNFVDIDVDKMTAMDHAGPHPMGFSSDRCYRIEGRYDTSGGGGARAVLVSAVDGAVSQEMGRTTLGLYYMSENGFCYTNGFQAINLSKHLRKTYKDLPNKYRGSVAYDGNNKRAYFAVEWPFVAGVTNKNNAIFALDEEWVSGERGCFTTITSDADLQPTCLFFDSENQRLLIGDKRGYVFKFDPDCTTDLAVNTAAEYGTWKTKAVVPDYISTAWSFGSVVDTKWVTKLYLIFKNLTGRLSLDLFSYNDDKLAFKRLKEVRDRKAATSGVHSIVRWFKRQSLRCTYKQVQIKKGFVTLAASDDFGLVTTDGFNTAQLPTNWPTDDGESLIGHVLYLASDGYTEGWEITNQSGDTLTILDPTASFPTLVGVAWVVKGFPKTEKFELHGLSVDYEVLGNTFGAYKTGGDGNNT